MQTAELPQTLLLEVSQTQHASWFILLLNSWFCCCMLHVDLSSLVHGVKAKPDMTATICRATFDTDNIDIGPERRAYLDHRLSRAWEVNSQVCMCYLGTPIPLASVPCTSQMCMTWLYGYTHLLLPEATASKSQSSPACHTISPAALYYAHLLILLLVALSHLNVAVSAALCHASCIC